MREEKISDKSMSKPAHLKNDFPRRIRVLQDPVQQSASKILRHETLSPIPRVREPWGQIANHSAIGLTAAGAHHMALVQCRRPIGCLCREAMPWKLSPGFQKAPGKFSLSRKGAGIKECCDMATARSVIRLFLGVPGRTVKLSSRMELRVHDQQSLFKKRNEVAVLTCCKGS